MLKNRDIIYFASHDFDLAHCKTSTDHIADKLSKDNRLLFVESIGMRKPRFDRHDLSRIFRKIKRFFLLLRKINGNFYVCTPIAIPLHHISFIQKINQILLRIFIKKICLFLRFKKPILFVSFPSMHGVVGKLDEAISIYYCVDECSEFPGVDRDSMKRMEIELLKKVNLGFATSPQILESKKKINPNFYLSIHGVDYDNFKRAQDPDLPLPKDVRRLKRPVIGYFGAIERWMDLDLIHYLVQKKKEWTFLFIGKPIVDLSRFDNEPNIHFIGQRPFQELPRYGKIFDVAIIPFVINKLTEHVFPVKLKEYLSMGKPVVSSALPTVEGFCKENPDIVHIGYNPDDFMNKIETAIPTNTAFHISARQDSIKKDVWESRVKEISDIIEKHLAL